MKRTAVAECGQEFEMDGYENLPNAVTLRVPRCPKCSEPQESNPEGLAIDHMVSMPHPEGSQEVEGSLGPQP